MLILNNSLFERSSLQTVAFLQTSLSVSCKRERLGAGGKVKGAIKIPRTAMGVISKHCLLRITKAVRNVIVCSFYRKSLLPIISLTVLLGIRSLNWYNCLFYINKCFTFTFNRCIVLRELVHLKHSRDT